MACQITRSRLTLARMSSQGCGCGLSGLCMLALIASGALGHFALWCAVVKVGSSPVALVACCAFGAVCCVAGNAVGDNCAGKV